jgi:acetyltransferase
MLDFAAPMGIGFSSVLSFSAGIGVGFGELLDFLLLDAATDGILLYIEDTGDARAFMSALRSAARTKPVVALKAGRSQEDRQQPSHDAVFDAALRRAGTVRVQTYTQLFAASRILAVGRIPDGNRLAIVSTGHGPALLAADSASERGVTLAKLTSSSVAALDKILPALSAPANPIDVRGDAPPARLAAAVDVALSDPNVDAVLALHVAGPATGATDSARAVADVARKSRKPVFGAWLGALDRHEADAALDAGNIANFFTPETAVEAFSFLAAYRANQRWLLEVPPSQPMPDLPDFDAVERIRERAERERKSRLDRADSAALLAAFGIRAVPTILVETLTEAEAAAARLRFPVTLTFDNDSSHATSLRGVRSRTQLAKAWAALHLEGSAHDRESAAGRVIVRRQVARDGAGAFAIGVTVDRVFGPVISLAAGAHTLQASAARALMLPPLNESLAADLMQAALASIRTDSAAGESERGAMQQVLLRVSTLVCALPWVRALELDPVVAIDGDAQVLDARIVVDPKQKPTPGYGHMAIHPYPVELIGTIALRDGTMIAMRPIMPEDAERERRFVQGLSDQSRYFRFFYQLHELTPAMLARFTQVDYDRELALVALAPDGESIIGVARYIVNPDHESAEFAIVVADEWQGRGVARPLMEHLIASAKRRGLARLQGAVLKTNQKMLRFTKALGFSAHDDPEDHEQVVAELAL